MKGKNSIQINQATMIEAMQMYLDSQFAINKAPRVYSVKRHTSGLVEFFVIETLEEIQEEVKTPYDPEPIIEGVGV